MTANKEAWAKVNKAWVPAVAHRKVKPYRYEIHGNEGAVESYIESLGKTWSTCNTIRMAQLSYGEQQLEMVIPTHLIQNPIPDESNDGKPALYPNLELRAFCSTKIADLGDRVGADWLGWNDNVMGVKPVIAKYTAVKAETTN